MKQPKKSKIKLASIYPIDGSKRSPSQVRIQDSSLSSSIKPNINSLKRGLIINLPQFDNQPNSVVQLITHAKTLSLLSPQQRKDKFGTPIIKGKKQHQVSFNPILQQVIVIENWKIHNILTIEDEPICPCQLI